MTIRMFSPACNDLPAIDVIGENEHEAAHIYMTMYNYHLLSYSKLDGTLSNHELGDFATTMVTASNYPTLNDVNEYMEDVHQVTVQMEVDED